MTSALMLLSATTLAQPKQENEDADGDSDGDLGAVIYDVANFGSQDIRCYKGL